MVKPINKNSLISLSELLTNIIRQNEYSNNVIKFDTIAVSTSLKSTVVLAPYKTDIKKKNRKKIKV
jgi:hypothetical protein